MVVHPVSHGVSRVPRYSGSRLSAPAFGYGALTLSSRPSHAVLLASSDRDVCPQPRRINPPVWPPPRSLATTCGISVDFFSSPYLDVSVQAVPHRNLWIQLRLLKYCFSGFPHSEIRGSMLICSSPQLIAACHVLHRLLMPRHSPCALNSLTYSFVSKKCLCLVL